MKVCIWCRAPVPISRARPRKFCSSACYTAWRAGRPRPAVRKRVKRTCLVCGTRFETGGRAGSLEKETCSNACKYKARVRSARATVRTLTVRDAAYIAGFFDGEGSVVAYMRRDVVAIRAVFSNTNRPLLESIRDQVGAGHIVSFEHPAARNHRAAHQLMINSEPAGAVLRQLLPFLRLKGAQARLAIDTLARLGAKATKADRSWHRGVHERMKAMNARGRKT